MKKNKVSSWIFIIIMLIVIYLLFGLFKSYYFNGFIKAETTLGKSEFRRDKDVRYSDDYSYKIISTTQNDAAFYKEIKVEPHTPYRLTCMVKTENVIPSAPNTDAGACISIIEQSEISKSITGTNDWQKIELMFNSQNRETIKLGCRLGGNLGTAEGTAWFSDFKLEKGLNTDDSTWKVACFIFENTDVEINGEKMIFSMSMPEIESIKSDMERFKSFCNRASLRKLGIEYDIYNIKEPIHTFTYSDEHKYYFDPYDAKDYIEDIVLEKEYDYIFTVVKMGNEHKEIPVANWVGLGSMDLYGIGYANIRLSDKTTNYIYDYNYRMNTFPEEVFVHEYLHTLERISKELGFVTPDLHDYKDYGYEEKPLTGLEAWYQDYVSNKIYDKITNEYIGIKEEVFKFKPVKKNNFKFPLEIDYNKEPNNLFGEIRCLFNVIADAV